MKVKHLAALHDPNARSAHPVSETCDVSRCKHSVYNLPFGYSIFFFSFTGMQKCPRLMKESGTRLGLVEVCKGVHEISDTLQLSNRSVRSGAVEVEHLKQFQSILRYMHNSNRHSCHLFRMSPPMSSVPTFQCWHLSPKLGKFTWRTTQDSKGSSRVCRSYSSRRK